MAYSSPETFQGCLPPLADARYYAAHGGRALIGPAAIGSAVLAGAQVCLHLHVRHACAQLAGCTRTTWDPLTEASMAQPGRHAPQTPTGSGCAAVPRHSCPALQPVRAGREAIPCSASYSASCRAYCRASCNPSSGASCSSSCGASCRAACAPIIQLGTRFPGPILQQGVLCQPPPAFHHSSLPTSCPLPSPAQPSPAQPSPNSGQPRPHPR